MAEPFASHVDVEARWRPLSDAEDAVADTLCADASSMIRSRWPDIDVRVATDPALDDSVLRIVANMVKRAMIHGDTDGLESRAQTAGPFSVSDKFSNPDGSLYFKADEVTLLEGDGYRPRVRMGWLA